MHNRATWVVAGFVAVVAIAATLDAVFFRGHAPASTRRASSITSTSVETGTTVPFGALPACTPDDLALRVESREAAVRDGTTLPPGTGVSVPSNLPAHDTGADLQFIQGHGCTFSTDRFRIQVLTHEGQAQGILRVLGGGRPREFFDLYGPQSIGIAGRFLPFRFSPACGERGPYFASAEVGPYAASQKIRVLRCGITPPRFHHALPNVQ